ncbi:succinyldiaminopimelate transaminase [Streptomyces thioluteus]|uniref:succinyldiaminopimelate transaminase n=1 Tax=Streptomyces thioluteus TaxID=66431 RepID=UPI0031E6D74A
MSAVSSRLPVFPWDRLEPYKATAAAHPDGIVDLSVGTPVDPVPALVRRALADAADSPGYPTVWGTPALRDALTGWVERRLGAKGVEHTNVLPVVGSKELVAWLPTQLGLGPGDKVAYPRLAYPTYEVGARLAGTEPVVYDEPTDLDPTGLKLLWLNSPSNPTGRVLSAEELRRTVAWAREHGVLVFSDECYLELGWETEPVSVLHPDVCGGSFEGIVAVHSLSKRSNLAGYRAAFLAGDAARPGRAAPDPQARRHDGRRPGAGGHRGRPRRHRARHRAARARYAHRRAALRAAFEGAGFRIEHSEASLYLWATRDEPCWDTVGALAELGILVAPGRLLRRRGRPLRADRLHRHRRAGGGGGPAPGPLGVREGPGGSPPGPSHAGLLRWTAGSAAEVRQRLGDVAGRQAVGGQALAAALGHTLRGAADRVARLARELARGVLGGLHGALGGLARGVQRLAGGVHGLVPGVHRHRAGLVGDRVDLVAQLRAVRHAHRAEGVGGLEGVRVGRTGGADRGGGARRDEEGGLGDPAREGEGHVAPSTEVKSVAVRRADAVTTARARGRLRCPNVKSWQCVA